MSRKIVYLGIIVLIVFSAVYIRSQKPSYKAEDKKRLTLVTSVYPLYFLASAIGGDAIDIVTITPAGSEPHEYEPKPQDVAKIEQADIFLFNGGGVDSWAEKVSKTLSPSTVSFRATDDVLLLPSDEEDRFDPHIWLDPHLMISVAERVRDTLIFADRPHASDYTKRADMLIQQLQHLDVLYSTSLSACEHTTFITSHNAFSYLSHRYHLTQRAISGVNPEEEPTPQQLSDIADLAKKTGIPYIFFETLVSPKLAETLAQEVGAQTLVLNPIEGLTGEEMAAGKTYMSEMERNLQNLKIALKCR